MMVNNVTFTGMQKFMTAAAHEYLPTGKIFDKAEVKVAEKAAEEATKLLEDTSAAQFFNHRGNNVIDTAAAKLQELEAAKSYVKSHGGQVAEDVAEATV